MGLRAWMRPGHNLDMVLYITGQVPPLLPHNPALPHPSGCALRSQRVVAVTAVVGRFGTHEAPVEDGGTVILELSGGALVTLMGGYWIPSRRGETSWSVRGSDRW